MSNISISFTAQVTRVTAARGKDPRLQDQVKRCGDDVNDHGLELPSKVTMIKFPL